MNRLDVVTRAFDPERLQLARQLNKLTKTALAAVVDVTPSLISQYENGATRPTASNIRKIAFALGVHADFFVRERPQPSITDPRFRSLRSSSKAERLQAVAEAYLLWDAIQLFERHLRLPAVDIPRLPLGEEATAEDIEQTATTVREAWALPDGPIGHVVRQLEVHGIVVARLPLHSRRLDAFSIELGHRPFVILGDDKGDAARSRLDAAHELGHLVIHDEVDTGDGIVERQAQQFGAAFLLPADQIRPLLPVTFDLGRFIELKQQWGVSVGALLYRARHLGRLTDSSYRRAVTWMSAKGYRTYEPWPTPTAEAPVLLTRCAIALESLGISHQELANRLHVPGHRVASWLNESDQRPEIQLVQE